MKDKKYTDKQRLDWLEENLFFREKSKWDESLYSGYDQWVFFSPIGTQGDVRKIIDLAMKDQES
jgi:hypothetical protein